MFNFRLLVALVSVLAATLWTPRLASAQSPGPTPADRGGFTASLSLGVGFQNGDGYDQTGLSGLNFSIGGFVNDDVAILLRASGTLVENDVIVISGQNVLGESQADFTCGSVALTTQYWMSDQLNVEFGAGLGVLAIEGDGVEDDDTGFGLYLGAAFAPLVRGSNALYIGVEFAPVFLERSNVLNTGIVIGFQFL